MSRVNNEMNMAHLNKCQIIMVNLTKVGDLDKMVKMDKLGWSL